MTKKAVKISETPPSHLSEDAKQFWRSTLEDFDLEDDAKMLLRVTLEQFDRLQQAREAIKRDGLTLFNKPHPALQVEKQAVSAFYRGLRQMGLDLAAPGEKVGRKL